MGNRKSRRAFLKTAGTIAGALAIASTIPLKNKSTLTEMLAGLDILPSAYGSVQIPQVPLAGKSIPKYMGPMPQFGTAGAPRVNAMTNTSLTVTMSEFQKPDLLPASIYAALPFPYRSGTYVWGYGIYDSTGTVLAPPYYPAFTIEAMKGTPISVRYVNQLGNSIIGAGAIRPVLQQYITVDQTIHWADPLMAMGSRLPYTGPVPAVTHLHGGEVPSISDGGPDAWSTPGDIIVGPAWSLGVTATYPYPNSQECTTLWFHDHTLGATRLNVYTGLAGFYFLRDGFDTGVAGTGLNLPAGPQEIEIVIQDRQFDTNGQLLFPDGSPAGLNGPPPNPQVHPYWNPEFFGDVIVVNGTSWPYMNVEPRRYRLRFLNGSNARFYDLNLGTSKLSFWHIGTDGGLLDAPVNTKNLFIAPGERADVIVDFAAVAGSTITMMNTAKAPYPKGTAPDPSTVGQIMQFRVGTVVTGGTDTSFNPAAAGATLRGGASQPPLIVRLADPIKGTVAAGVTPDLNRLLTLKEVATKTGPLEVLVNNTKWDGTLSPNAGGITELSRQGSTELWEIVNLTMDAHPIHLHLVQFQLVNRQAFNTSKYVALWNSLFPGAPNFGTPPVTYAPGVFIPGYGPPLPYTSTNPITAGKLGGNPDVTPYLQGKASPPLPEEAGWKDTFKMFPGEVTRVIARWAPQDIAIGGVSAGTNLYPFDPKTGPGYVWHCHIIDHEDNEMMRPYTVAA